MFDKGRTHLTLDASQRFQDPIVLLHTLPEKTDAGRRHNLDTTNRGLDILGSMTVQSDDHVNDLDSKFPDPAIVYNAFYWDISDTEMRWRYVLSSHSH
jgi:hypothetical protein